MALIEINSITKSFGDLTVLKEFSSEFSGDGLTAILGPSGTGKSTLLRCINALEPIDSGEITVDGLSVLKRENTKKIRLTCGMVFQQTVLFPHLDVMENLILGPTKLLNKSKDESITKARELLEKVGLLSKEHSKHNELSGGEQQRIAIARALMMDPKALLLDEITSALDPEMSADVLAILEKLANEGIVMLMVTHEVTFAQKVAKRIIFLESGKAVCDVPTKEFFTTVKNENPRIAAFVKHIMHEG